MAKLPKECNILQIEEKWEKKWEEMGIYRFDRRDTKLPVYTIDTPPPYPSGDFHMGNVLNWTYFDIVARFKRMTGHSVLFPQGWDCHGLPTEVQTEEKFNVKKTDMSPTEFSKLCEQLVEKYIDVMKSAIVRLGCSVDWTTEYRTMDPDYWRRTQLSFIMLYNQGLIYRGSHAVNWCPRCETAIADAEVEHETHEGHLHYIKFKIEGDNSLTIATTRPELLFSCITVAVNTNDERYKKHIGETIFVPVAEKSVKILSDEMVDPSFGTGVVMICSYGDKADVNFVAKYHLPVILSIDEKGKMNEKAGKYAGMRVKEAKKSVVIYLEQQGLLEKVEKIQQEVRVCWRCKTPIEILERKQWFMKTRIFTDEVEKNALEVKWYPDYMKKRLIDWARSLDWDWVISRQRVFATPIPIWYCSRCGEAVISQLDWVPIDPKTEVPKLDSCPKCGSKEFWPETDVLDTWFDSSISCAVHAGWPDDSDWVRCFPADIHPSGADIIRTWAYYLMVRHLALFRQKPYKSCLINGMVLGVDGRKMSKSLGNYIATPDVFNKYGADATRQWAAGGGATGSDIPFRWSDAEFGWRFLIKLWNAARFCSLHLENYKPQQEVRLEILDKWMISKLENVTEKVTNALENCNFNIALEETRNFTWHTFCDSYIEVVKHRLYQPETFGEEKKAAAQYTLYTTIYRILQLLAPISPHLTEEIYQTMYSRDKKHKSIHVSPWPTFKNEKVDNVAEGHGDLIVSIIAEIQRDKAEKGLPLNGQIKKLIIYAANEKAVHFLGQAVEDIKGTCKILEAEILPDTGEGRTVQGYTDIHFAVEY